MNECLIDNGGCEQSCQDTPLGFECQCGSGYTLNADELSCDGNDNYADINVGATPTHITPSLSQSQFEDGLLHKRDIFSILSCSLGITATLTSCYTQCLQRAAYIGT